MKFVLIGAGKVGTSISSALVSKGWECLGVGRSHLSGHTDERIKKYLASRVFPIKSLAHLDYDVMIISVKDDYLAGVVERLSEDLKVNWKGKYLFHTSGALGLDMFRGIENKGGLTGSLHPVATFPKKYEKSQALGIYYDFFGSAQAARVARAMVRLLESKIIILNSAHQKAYLHIASVFASNFVTIALLAAERIMSEKCGVKKSKEVLSPLLLSSVENFLHMRGTDALTGPLARGDRFVVESHLKFLENEPDILQFYRSASKLGIELLSGDGLFRNNKQSLIKLRKLLEEFS